MEAIKHGKGTYIGYPYKSGVIGVSIKPTISILSFSNQINDDITMEFTNVNYESIVKSMFKQLDKILG